MNLENLLRNVIEIYENDIQCGLDIEERKKVAPIISELIIVLTRLLLDFRYCSQKECPCSPEYIIKQLIQKHEGYYKQYIGEKLVQKILEYVGG